jgi:hypothetical protein
VPTDVQSLHGATHGIAIYKSDTTPHGVSISVSVTLTIYESEYHTHRGTVSLAHSITHRFPDHKSNCVAVNRPNTVTHGSSVGKPIAVANSHSDVHANYVAIKFAFSESICRSNSVTECKSNGVTNTVPNDLANLVAFEFADHKQSIDFSNEFTNIKSERFTHVKSN